MRRGYYRNLNHTWRSLKSVAPTRYFDQSMIENLPEPVNRYFLHSIRPDTLLSNSVQLEMSGQMRLKPNGKWMSMKAKQILAPPRGFVWKAQLSHGLLRMSGADHYFDGSAGLRFWLFGIIPMANAIGPDIDQSAAGRLAIESIWIPSALLPDQGAEWEAVDNNNARVTVPIGQFTETLLLNIGDGGELQRVEMLRWGDKTEDGRFARIPFSGNIEEEGTFGGYTIPTRMNVGWWPNTERYFEFFQATIDKAEFYSSR